MIGGVAPGNPTLTYATTTPSPAIVGQDATLTLTGTNLNGASPFFSPAIMGMWGVNVSSDGTSLTATVRPTSAGSGSVDVSVTKLVNGSSMNAGPLPVSVQNPPPTLTANSLSPTQVLVNRSSGFSFSGANFVQGAVVLVNGASVTLSSLSTSNIGFSFTPSMGGTYTVLVQNPTPGGGTSATLQFSVNNPDPTLSAITPTSVPAGTVATITLTGTNFATNATVELDGPVTTWTTITTVTVLSSTQLTVTIPGGNIAQSGTYSLRVVNPAPGGGTSGARSLTVMNLVPVLTALSPSTTSATGTSFVIGLSGQNFVSTSRVVYNGVQLAAASVNVVSPTELLATLPSAPITSTTHFLYVQNPPVSGLGGGTSATLALTIEYPAPRLTSISPTSTNATARDWQLTVNGTLFAPTSIVRVNGQAMTTSYVSATKLEANIPGAFTRNTAFYTVQVFTPSSGFPSSGGGTSTTLQFSVNNPDPTFSAITPTSVPAGTVATITLTGTNFATNATVELDGPAFSWTTLAGVSVLSSTQLTVSIPGATITQSGSYTLRVVNPAPGGGQSGNRTLTVVPAALARVEFIGVTTAITAGGLDAFTVRFSDAFGNLRDTDIPAVSFRDAAMTSTGTIALRRSSRGVSTATATVYTIDGDYTLSLPGLPVGVQVVGNTAFTVRTNVDFFVRFENVTAHLVAGQTLASFRATYLDRVLNPTDRGIGKMFLRKNDPINGSDNYIVMNRVSEGVYESAPFPITTAATFYLKAEGIRIERTSYRATSGTVIDGALPAIVVRHGLPVVELLGLEQSLNAGTNLNTFDINIEDAYGNDIPSPDVVRITMSNSTTATGGIRTSTATLDVPLRAGKINIYDVPQTRVEWQGVYTVSVGDYTLYKSAARQFTVNALAVQSAEFAGVDSSIMIGKSTSAFTVLFRDKFLNRVPHAVNVSFAKTGSPTSTGTISLTAMPQTGLYTAAPTAFFTPGTYLLTVSGVAAGNLLGRTTFSVLAPPVPVLTALSPATVILGKIFSLTIRGTNFTSEAQIILNGQEISPSSITPDSVIVILGPSVLNTTGAYNLVARN